jgi:hypothetical protein
MSRLMSGVVLAAAVVLLTAVASPAQQTTSSSATKTFEVLAVEGNQLVVRLPEGTRELTVPDDFRFIIEGRPMSVHELIVGMKGTATITTQTTVTPVTVTEVKNGTVVVRSGSTIIVRTNEGVRSFTQSEVDKRGVKIFRDGKPVQLSELHEGNKLSATIITSRPPKVMTQQEVNATLATEKAAAAAAPPAATAPARSAPAAATAPAPTRAPAAAAAPAATSGSAAQASTPAATRTLPKTASSWPLFGLVSVLSLAIGFALTIRRRLVR